MTKDGLAIPGFLWRGRVAALEEPHALPDALAAWVTVEGLEIHADCVVVRGRVR